jgi:hypothetical protein
VTKVGNIAVAALVIVTSPIWVTVVILVLLAMCLRLVVMYALAWGWWIGPRRKRVLFVYSNSPNWELHLQRTVIPRLPQSAVVLNWSERKRWPRRAVSAWLFRFFSGDREFNPIGLVFERFALVRTYRFWEPFRAMKHGHPEAVESLQESFLKDAAR